MATSPTVVKTPSATPLRRIIAYASGEGANSITLNGISAFALLFYVQVLGLSGKWAGVALSVTMLWDAVSDPIMGHITDNTRSRFGRRHPYILLGGIFLAASFFFLWTVPGIFKSPRGIFWYLLGINFIVRTAVTIFGVPYAALGFEICTDYEERAKLQSVRCIFNMAMNFLFTAAGWVLFFGDRKAADGSVIDGTTIVANYRRMGTVLSLAALAFILVCYFSTKRYAYDTRSSPGIQGNSLKAFFLDMRDILRDRLAVMVYGFYGVATLGMLLVSQVQMFTYRFYMGLPDILKTTVHGSTMAGFAVGSFLATSLVKRLDKKPAAAVGVALNVIGNGMLYIVFMGGIISPQATLRLPDGLPIAGGGTLPLAAVVLAFFQAMYWAGNGIIVPVSASMIADMSEINKLRNGILKDGSYSAVYSFANKAACSLGLLITGLILDWAGIIPDAAVQSAAASRNVARLTFISGPVFALLALLIILPYAVNRERMAKVKTLLASVPKSGT
ncbi:MAG: MFS transporter [Acidobacteriota bacterium]|nr:MFS transporter [Acidobacteriota bacterium]